MATNALTNTAPYNYLGFNLSPAATTGQGAYGLVPGQTGAPTSNWSQLMQNVPGFSGATDLATGDINNELSGKLSSGTMGMLQDKAAAFGVGAGTPFTGNSGLPLSNYLESIGTSSEALKNKGISDYLGFTGTAGNMQVDPALQTGIAQTNAVLGSAPDPATAATTAQALVQQYIAQMGAANQNRPSGGGYSSSFGNPAAGFGTGSIGMPSLNGSAIDRSNLFAPSYSYGMSSGLGGGAGTYNQSYDSMGFMGGGGYGGAGTGYDSYSVGSSANYDPYAQNAYSYSGVQGSSLLDNPYSFNSYTGDYTSGDYYGGDY